MITKIRAIITDVDGVLTDGGIYYDSAGHEMKKFNAKDGMAIGMLHQAGFKIGVITGRNSQMVARRIEELGIDFYVGGANDKLLHFQNFKNKFGLHDTEIAYIGDDINDLAVMLRCGLKACPSDSFDYIKANMNYIARKKGGEGVFREFADWILQNQGKLDQIVRDKYNFEQ